MHQNGQSIREATALFIFFGRLQGNAGALDLLGNSFDESMVIN